MKTLRNRPEWYTCNDLAAIDEKMRDYGLLVAQHLVPLDKVYKTGQRNPKWHIQVSLGPWGVLELHAAQCLTTCRSRGGACPAAVLHVTWCSSPAQACDGHLHL